MITTLLFCFFIMSSCTAITSSMFTAQSPELSTVNLKHLTSVSAEYFSKKEPVPSSIASSHTNRPLVHSSDPSDIAHLYKHPFKSLELKASQLSFTFNRYIESVSSIINAYLLMFKVDPLAVEGNVGSYDEKIQFLLSLYSDPQIETICEVGFNAGHSSLAALVSKSNNKVYAFDLGIHSDYVQRSFDILSATFSTSRLKLIFGNSLTSVPSFKAAHRDLKCNVIFIDGGHSEEIATADITNFFSLANTTFHVLVVDDTEMPTVRTAIAKLENEGMIAMNTQGGEVESRTVLKYKAIDANGYNRNGVYERQFLPELRTEMVSKLAYGIYNLDFTGDKVPSEPVIEIER